jgi:hypothetical protein
MLWDTGWDRLSPIIGDATDVEICAGWIGTAGTLANALVVCGGEGPGFLELANGRYQIHDFLEHAPKWVRDKVTLRETLAAAGKTITDIRRDAGKAGAMARWHRGSKGKSSETMATDGNTSKILPKSPDTDGKPVAFCHSDDGKPDGSSHEKVANDALPLPSLIKKKEKEEKRGEPSGSPSVGNAQTSAVVEIWNTRTAGVLPSARMTPKRHVTITSALRDSGWIDDFAVACAYAATNPFHRGQNDRSWVATLDWLLQVGKATEVADKAKAKATAAIPTGKIHVRSETDANYIAQLAARDAQRPGHTSTNSAIERPDDELLQLFE